MLTLVRRARRRFFYNELLSQGANAASAALLAVEDAMAAGRAAAELRGRGEPVPPDVAAAEEQAAPVLTGVRAKLDLTDL